MSKFDKNILVNRYPYWLFWNYKTVAYLDTNNMMLESKYRKSKFSKASSFQIILIKYVPFLLMFIFLIKLPQSKEEWIISISVATYIGLAYMAYRYSQFMIKFLLGVTLLGFYMALFKFDVSGRSMNVVVAWFLKMYIMLFVLYDYFVYGYKNYFYLEDIIESGHVSISKFKKRPILRVPFTEKYLFHVPTGFNAGFNYSFGGYFFKVVVENSKAKNE